MENNIKSVNHNDLATVQLIVLSCAVEALIAEHPHPEKVRVVFDQLFGQIQAGLLVSGGATPAATDVARQVADKLFSSLS